MISETKTFINPLFISHLMASIYCLKLIKVTSYCHVISLLLIFKFVKNLILTVHFGHINVMMWSTYFYCISYYLLQVTLTFFSGHDLHNFIMSYVSYISKSIYKGLYQLYIILNTCILRFLSF